MNLDTENLWGLFLAYGVNGVGIAAPLVYYAARVVPSLTRAAAARLRTRGKNRLTEGRVTLEGTVERDDESGAPTKPVAFIEIKQKGESHEGSGAGAHTWTETSRVVDVKPFRITLDSGETVHVEADKRVKIRKEEVNVQWIGSDRRRHMAEIHPGERVTVEGHLTRKDQAEGGSGYRGGRRDVFLLSSTDEAPITISTEPTAVEHLRRAGVDGGKAIVLAAWLAVVQGVFLREYTNLVLHAQHVTGRVTTVMPVDSGYSTRRVEVTVDYQRDPSESPTSVVFRTSTDVDTWVPGKSVEYLVLPNDPRFRLEGTYAFPATSAVAYPPFITLLLLFALRYWKYKPSWYEQKRVQQSNYGPLR